MAAVVIDTSNCGKDIPTPLLSPELKELFDRTSHLINYDEDDNEVLAQELLRQQTILCYQCSTAILTTDGVTVNQHHFHQECLACRVCQRLLSPHEELFPGKEEGVMCSSCAQTNLTKLRTTDTCCMCKEDISDSPMMALERLWHEGCFTCNTCDIVLTSLFRDHEGIPYCESCWLANYGNKCSICKEYIIDSVMTIEEEHYHVHCVRCCVCGQVFENVIDILNIETDYWHIDCWKEEDDKEETSSITSALLGVYNSAVLSEKESGGKVPGKGRRRSTVSYTTPPPPQYPVVLQPGSPGGLSVQSVHSLNDEDNRKVIKSDEENNIRGRSTCCTIF